MKRSVFLSIAIALFGSPLLDRSENEFGGLVRAAEPRQGQGIRKPTRSRAPALTSRQAQYVRKSLPARNRDQLRSVAHTLARHPSSPQARRQWEQFIHQQARKQNKQNVDVNALVQWVMRESYLDMGRDLKYYADKVKYANELKKSARNRLNSIRRWSKTGRAPSKEWRTEIKKWESELQQVGDDSQLANIDLQNALQKQQQALQMMSNVSKMLHDTAMAVIRKIG